MKKFTLFIVVLLLFFNVTSTAGFTFESVDNVEVPDLSTVVEDGGDKKVVDQEEKVDSENNSTGEQGNNTVDSQQAVRENSKKNEKTLQQSSLNERKVNQITSLSVAANQVLSHPRNTSKLGQINASSARIYYDPSKTQYFTAGSEHTNRVYYIKAKKVVSGNTYYLISDLPSSTDGLVGWVNARDIKTYTHTAVDNHSKVFYFKGSGVAYNRPWGGTKNIVFTSNDLSKFRYQTFHVHMTQKVGNNTWYRGTFNGQTIWIHENHLTTKEESATSRLGKIKSSSVKIYRDVHNPSTVFTAGSEHTNRVYYIKKQMNINGDLFYLVSSLPSNTNGLIGWVHSSDITTYSHVSVDKQEKRFYVKGQGVAYNRAWGGSQNVVYSSQDMENLAGYEFLVHLTEKVGNNTWYRGILNGQTVWIHSNHLNSTTGNATSLLGQIYNSNVKIYTRLGDSSSIISAGSAHTNIAHYIKRETWFKGQHYYLISSKPSDKEGVIGWVNPKDITTYTHEAVDNRAKIFELRGTGVAYSRPWGGLQSVVFTTSQMANMKEERFHVHYTQKVGNNTWYRGTVKGQTVWIHSSHVKVVPKTKYSYYNLTLNQALQMQLNASPQTDKKVAYVSKSYVSNGKVTASTLNVRSEPSTRLGNKSIIGQLSYDASVKVLGEDYSGWYTIEYHSSHQWRQARPNDVLYYLNPKNFVNDERQMFQFLDLSLPSGASAAVLNNYLRGKGTLANQGQAFIDAANKHGINDIYLISHALLETGHGTSTLARGVKYNGVTVYNMFGIGAYDSCPVQCGAERAYKEGWTTPYKAIVGGAQFIGNSYIKAGLNTLYKMRWNPDAMVANGYIGKQYATDIGWASKQVSTMYNLYKEIGNDVLYLDIPVYK